jgi:putative ABC transport system permease protein
MLNARLLRSSLRSLLQRPWQTGLMVLGIALGVAVVVAIDLANASAQRSFTLSTESLVGRATHRISGGPSGVPEDLYRQLRLEAGLRASAPVVEGLGIAIDLDEQPVRILGLDPLAEAPFRDFFGDQGISASGLARFYTDPDAVLLSVATAEQYGLQLGSSLRLQVGDRIETLVVAGLLEPAQWQNRAALDGVLIMDIAAAQELLDRVGRLTGIDLILGPEEADALADALPSSVSLLPASQQAQTAGQLTDAFQLNLTALSLLALVVGMFLIYNTVMFSVVQRRAVLGTMRALGLTSAQLFGMVLAEAGLVSLLGSGLGVGLGWALGRGAVGLVSQTINDLYYVLSVRETPLTLATVWKGVGLGMGAGLIGALLPALEAASVPPVTAIQRSSLEARARRWLPWVAGVGCGLIAAGAVVLWTARDSVLASLVALSGVVVGMALLVPAATVAAMQLALPLLGAIGGPLARMAPRNVVRSLSRTGIALAALSVSLSVTIGVSTMISSFRGTVSNWLNLVLRADLYVSAPGPGGAETSVRLPPELVGRLGAVPGVARAEPYRTVETRSEFGTVLLTAVDGRRGRDASLYRFAQGGAEAVWSSVLGGAVIASEPLAYRAGLPPRGASLELQTDRGPHRFPVAAIYYDYSADRGGILMTLETYHQFWDDRSLTSIGVFVEPGQDLDEMAVRLRQALSGTGLQVVANRSLRQQALAIFDRTFAITDALRILAVVVAVIGIVSALMALTLERTRELATMQALGSTVAQLRRLTLLETGLMGAVAGVLSWPIGLVLAAILVYVINLRSFGWTIRMELQAGVLAQALLLSLAAAMSASIYPLRHLQQVEVAAALRQE